MINRKSKFKIISTIILANSLWTLFAQDDNDEIKIDLFESEAQYAEVLISTQPLDLKDLAILQLEKMSKLYPSEQDYSTILLAEIYDLQRQTKRFDEQISKIKPESKYYPRTLILLANRDIRSGKTSEGLKRYDKYFELLPNPPESPTEKDIWKEAIETSSQFLGKEGKSAEAQARKDLILLAIDEDELKIVKRRINYEKALSALNYAETVTIESDVTAKFDGKSGAEISGVKLPNKFTIEVMGKDNFTGGSPCLVRINDQKTNRLIFSLEVSRASAVPTTNITCIYAPGSADNKIQLKNSIITGTNWYQISVTYDGKTMRLYQDGELLSEAAKDFNVSPDVKVYIGGSYDGGGKLVNAYNGQIDNVRILDFVKNQVEIGSSLYHPEKSDKVILDVTFENKKVEPKGGTYKFTEIGKIQWDQKNSRNITIANTIELLNGNIGALDPYVAFSVVELMHAYYLNANYKKVNEFAKNFESLFKSLDDSMKGEEYAHMSPVAGASYYIALSYIAAAERNLKAAANDKAKKGFEIGLNGLSTLIEKYPKSPYSTKANIIISDLISKLKDVGFEDHELAEYNSILSSGGFDANLSKANVFYEARKYADAAESYRAALASKTRGTNVSDALYRLIKSMLANDKFELTKDCQIIEIEAVAEYLLQAAPTSNFSALICLDIGSYYARLEKDAKYTLEEKKLLRQAAMNWYDEFVKLKPNDEQAPRFKNLVADAYRDRANQVAEFLRIEKLNFTKKGSEKGRTLTDEQIAVNKKEETASLEKQEELTNRLNFMLSAIIPRYLDIIENYPESEFAKRSIKVLGSIYTTLGDREKAAEGYLKYAKIETNPKEFVNIPLILSLAGDEYRRDLQPKKAIDAYKNVIEYVAKNKLNDNNNKKIVEQVYHNMAWSLFMAGESYANKFRDIENEIYDLRSTIREKNGEVRTQKRLIEGVEKTIEELAKKQKMAIDDLIHQVGLPNLTTVERTSTMTDELYQRTIRLEMMKDQKKLKQARDFLRTSYTQNRAALKNEKMKNEAEFKRLELEIETINAEIKSIEFASRADAKNIPALEARIDKLDSDIKKMRDIIEKERIELSKIEKQLDELKPDLESPLEKERIAAQVKQIEISETMRPLQIDIRNKDESLNNLLEKRSIEGSRIKTRIESAKIRVNIGEEELAKHNVELKKKEALINYYKLRDKSIIVGLGKTNADEALYNAKEKDMAKAETDLSKITADYRKLVEEDQAAIMAYHNLTINFYKKHIDNISSVIAKTEKNINELENNREPNKNDELKLKKEAIPYFIDFLKRYPKSENYAALDLSTLGKIYINLGNFENATKYLDQLKNDYPNSPLNRAAAIDLGDAYLKITKFDLALQIYIEIVKNQKDYQPSQLLLMQRKLLELADKNEIRDDIKKLINVSAELGECFINRLKEQGIDKKLQDYKGMSEFRTAEAYFLVGDYITAEKYYNLVLSNPRTTYKYKANHHLGVSLRDKNPPNINGALHAFSVITGNMDSVPIDLYLTTLLDMAIAESKRETYFGINNSIGTYSLIISGFNKDESSLFPIYEETYNNLINSLCLIGKKSDAEKYLEDYKKHFPTGKYLNKLKKLPEQKYSEPIDTNNKINK